MAIIDTSYFFGGLLIPQAEQASVTAKLQLFIDKMEDEYLEQMLGYAFAKLYKAGIIANTQIYLDIQNGKEYTDQKGDDQKWKGLRFTTGTSKRSPVANFVYFYFMRTHITKTTASGEGVVEKENMKSTSAAPKQTEAWNEMVRMNNQLVEFLLVNEAIYPAFKSYHEKNKDRDVLRISNPTF